MAETFHTPFGDIDPAAAEAAAAAAAKGDGRRNIEEVTIKFAKGLCSEPFVSKDGKEFVRIQIPNSDPADHDPWQEFVLESKQVHENQYGKGLWAKIPADGHTTVSRPFLAGKDENGRNIWDSKKRTVSNRELKEMVEFYKTRGRDERTSSQADRKETQENASVTGKDLSEAEPDHHPEKEKAPPGRKASVKELLETGKKEAGRTGNTAAKTLKKQHAEPER
jgi:hypothetical protein